jgi:hydroxymethylpyrimidine pyrophosphatase-like HAD family hydrolase
MLGLPPRVAPWRAASLEGTVPRPRPSVATVTTPRALRYGVHFDLEHPVLVYACDIDGCLAAVGHAAYDLVAMQALAERNRASEDDPTIPALTFVTGRPHAYVDALMQALDVRLPVSFENGVGLATRHPYEAWLIDEAEAARGAMEAARALLEERDDVFVQFGKIASLSVFDATGERDVEALAAFLREFAAERSLGLDVDPSTDCVNLLLPGIDKAVGFGALCETLDLPEAAVAGIGDSVGDVGWLRRCGVSIAPAGAVSEVKDVVDAVSALFDVAAALQAYDALIAANRVLAAR